jgi:two-component system, NarL family, sensor histidine kinase EvgS
MRWVWGLAIIVAGLSCRLASAEIDAPVLTAEDRAWLARHPTIRVGYDPGWPPFSVRDGQGKFSGIDADLLDLLARRFGFKFEFVTRPTWPEVYDAAKTGEIDMLVGTARTAERERDFLFTRPYLTFPVVIVTRNDEPMVWSVLDLVGRRVAGVRGYVATSELQRMYPGITFQLTDTVQEGLATVSNGKADAFVTNLPNVSFVAKTRGLTNLKIAGVVPQTFDLRYAVRRDWPELIGILDRAGGSLSEADRQAIVHPWVRVDYARVIRWDLVWKTALVTLIVGALGVGFILHRNRRLARELAARNLLLEQVEKAHRQLEVLHQDRSELMHMAAHDLRSPLTAIAIGLDQIQQSGGGGELDERLKSAVRQMSRLIDDLLDVHTLEDGKREFHFAPVDVAALVREVVEGLAATAAQKGIVLEYVSSAEILRWVPADDAALRQVVDNLLSNAMKFSPPNSRVRVSLRYWNESVRLEIQDSGPGVPLAEKERIFSKYARGTARPTAGEKSTGLGLAIVRQLVTAMNGRVWCDNAGEKGAIFAVTLPVTP